MTQDVDSHLVSLAGDAFGLVYDQAKAAVQKLAGVLKGSAGMAGTDNGAHAWASKYDTFCGGHAGGEGLMEAASLAIMGAAQCSDLLHTTAINHQNADHQSAINNNTAPAFPPNMWATNQKVPTLKIKAWDGRINLAKVTVVTRSAADSKSFGPRRLRSGATTSSPTCSATNGN